MFCIPTENFKLCQRWVIERPAYPSEKNGVLTQTTYNSRLYNTDRQDPEYLSINIGIKEKLHVVTAHANVR
jgi:hypothetical protein